MSDYDYPALIRAACRALPEVEGRVLVDVLVQVVEPEFNVVTLVFEDGTYSIEGRVGSEILGIVPVPLPAGDGAAENPGTPGVRTIRFEAFAQFVGRRLTQARMIGEAWNGHGFEFTFEGLPDRSMLIQSVYSSPKPPGREDCLRLGVGRYAFGTDDAGQ